MIYDPEKHRRRSIRLPGYDYSLPGAYFVTACIRNREPLLGKITNGVMEMNPFGQVVRETWDQLPNHYGHIRLDCFAVMPNHVHGTIFVVDENTVEAGLKPVPADNAIERHAISEIIRGFKTFSSRRLNQLRRTPGQSVWQRNYFEHVVRDESALNRIRDYVLSRVRAGLKPAPTETTVHLGSDSNGLDQSSRLPISNHNEQFSDHQEMGILRCNRR